MKGWKAMSETIYTIPVNEVFDACAEDHSRGCPFCRLYNTLEANEIDIILGAAMMEPDIRKKTNEQSFCPTHFDQLLAAKNRLGLALILESHLNQLREEVEEHGLAALLGKVGTAAPQRLGKLDNTCYVCGRIEYSFSRMLSNAVLLWTEDEEFRAKVPKQPYICLPHFRMWLEVAQKEMRKGYADFYRAVSAPVYAYFDSLREDVSWFCKKFDYRYDNEPWGNSKDAVERARKFLCADLHKPVR
jgi:hypothetical protein